MPAATRLTRLWRRSSASPSAWSHTLIQLSAAKVRAKSRTRSVTCLPRIHPFLGALAGHLSLDGEDVEYGIIQAEVHPSLLRVYGPAVAAAAADDVTASGIAVSTVDMGPVAAGVVSSSHSARGDSEVTPLVAAAGPAVTAVTGTAAGVGLGGAAGADDAVDSGLAVPLQAVEPAV